VSARRARARACRLRARRGGQACAHHFARPQVRGVRHVWPGRERGHVVGGAGGGQPGRRQCLRSARRVRTHTAAGAATPRGRPAPRRPPPSRRRAAQAVLQWSRADALEALGGAAPSSAVPTAVLAQYHCGLCAVLALLAGAPALPPRSSPFAPEAAVFSDRRSVLSAASEARARARPAAHTPRAERAADRGPPRRSTWPPRRCCSTRCATRRRAPRT